MRVTFGAIQRQANEGITRASEQMVKFQRQVSTGKRVERPSDDPSAASIAVSERASVDSFAQFTAAADGAESKLRVADSVLSDLLDKLTAARSVVMSVRGSTATDAQREASADELRSLREAVLEDLNTAFRGTFLFGGAAGDTKPFSVTAGVVDPYAGSTQEVEVDIDRGRSVAVAFDGSAISQGADVADVFAAFDQAAAAAVAADSTALGDAFDAMGRAFDRATRAQSSVGASLRAVADHKLRLADSSRASSARLSTLEDANMVQAISGMNQAEVTYEAALGAAARSSQVSLFDYLK
jgi:flagellar hook-associated protein 3 FlgL